MNTNFSIGKDIDISPLQSRIPKKYMATYNPDTKSKALQVNIPVPGKKANHTIKVMIYASGNVIMTGGKNMAHIVKCFDEIISILDANPDMLYTQYNTTVVKKKLGRKRLRETIDDFNYDSMLM